MFDVFEIECAGGRFFRNTERFKAFDPRVPGVVLDLVLMGYQIIGAGTINGDTNDGANTGTVLLLQGKNRRLVMVLIERDIEYHDQLEDTVLHISSAEAEEIDA